MLFNQLFQSSLKALNLLARFISVRSALWPIGFSIAIVAHGPLSSATRVENLPIVPIYKRVFQGKRVLDEHGRPARVTPAQAAKLGGNLSCCGVRAGASLSWHWIRKWRDLVAETRREAEKLGKPVRIFIHVRPDIYKESEEYPPAPGFRDEWILRVPVRNYRSALERFETSGWTVDYVNKFSSLFLKRILKADSDTRPAFYGPLDHKNHIYRIESVLTDLRNPDYRAWHIAWVKRLMEFIGADAVTVTIKNGWLAYPMKDPPAEPTADNHGGPLNATPYGPGEFETAMGSYLLEIADLGIPVAIITAGGRLRYGPDKYPKELEDALLGRIRYISLPNERTRPTQRGRILPPQTGKQLPGAIPTGEVPKAPALHRPELAQ